MAGMRRFWEYGLVVTVAIAVGLVVAALVEGIMSGSSNGVTSDAGNLASLLVPAAAGVLAIGLTLGAGLRRLNRPRAKAGW
jgi:hypothetical protein